MLLDVLIAGGIVLVFAFTGFRFVDDLYRQLEGSAWVEAQARVAGRQEDEA